MYEEREGDVISGLGATGGGGPGGNEGEGRLH